ncbi:MAG: DUF4339 domain-containing protein [Chitinophagaceae bacterium]|nr:MAG: DUF4339 domain-containing protein [Chitinophagaceae bacterium]
MQKIYVLLRNEQQTGPYSLEEIIQFDLKPYDLIWIQGRSAGWYYPQEIAALHPYLGFLPKKQSPVSDTKPAFETATAATPTPAALQSFPASAGYPLQETVRKEVAPSSPAALEEAVFAQFREKLGKTTAATATHATTPTKKKRVPSAVVGLTTILVVGGVFAASWFLNRKDSMAAETPVELTAELSAPAEITGAEENPGEPNSKPSAIPVARKKKNTGTQSKTSPTMTTAPVSVVSTKSSDNSANETANHPNLENEPPVIQSTEEESESAGTEGAAPVEKKKKLRDKIFDLFKKKPETQQQEEAGPAENAPGERTASRRGEGSDLAQQVHVRFAVPNEWMMGIHGAKATLVNRSSETVQKATIEVQYFDDDNQLLQKKTVSFEKVGGKDSKTIPIPDHPTATKVDYSVVSVSVSGKPAA